MMVKSPRRSVIFRKSVTQADFVVGRSGEDLFKGSEKWIDSIECKSLDSLKKMGYDYPLNGKYFKISDKWIHREFLSKDECYGAESDLLYNILLKNCIDQNTEEIFLASVLKLTYFSRFFVARLNKEKNIDALEAFLISAEMMTEFMYWREEFPLSQWIAPTRQQYAGRKLGGEMVGKKTSQGAFIRHSQWQIWADEIWERNPKFTKSAVAKYMCRKEKIDFKADTVSRAIKKKGKS